jgi:hypothetical protein
MSIKIFGDFDSVAPEIRDALEYLTGIDRLDASAIKNLPFLSASEIVTALENLTGDDRLDASAIKNLLNPTPTFMNYIGTAGEAISEFLFVYGDSTSSGNLKIATNNGTQAQATVVGCCIQSGGIAQGLTGTYARTGSVTNPSWNLVPKKLIYLDINGGITQILPDNDRLLVILGWAETATEIWIEIQPPLILNAHSVSTNINNFNQNLSAIDTNVQLALETLDGLIAGGSVLYGTWATRPIPSASNLNYTHIPTDGYTQTICDGTNWNVFIDEFECVNPPDSTSLTAVNVGSTVTIADDGDGLIITQLGSASSTERNCHFLTSIPSAPYKFEVVMQPLYLYPAAWVQMGIVLTDGTNIAASKSVHFCLCFGTSGFPTLSATAQTNGTTVTVYLEQIHNCTTLIQKYVWFRFRDDNTTRFFEFSGNGRNWITYFSHGRTTHITPTYIGLTVQQGTSSVANTIIRSLHRIVHWKMS